MKDDLYATSLSNVFKKFTDLTFKLPKNINIIENNIKTKSENLCLVPLFRKADLIAIIKSSLLDSIFANIQKA